MKIRTNKGVTLLETMSATAILSVIFMMTFGVLDSGDRLWSVTDASAHNQLELREAFMDMERTIRGSTEISIKELEGPDELEITFNEYPIRFYMTEAQDGLTFQLHEERTMHDGTIEDRIIANNVDDCQYGLQDPGDGRSRKKLIITIRARKRTFRTGEEITFTLKHIVALRNQVSEAPPQEFKDDTG